MGRQVDLTLLQKLVQINWLLIILISLIACVGFAMLYSAANGHIDPWASRQMIRYGAGLVLMLLIAVIDIRAWLRHAYLIYAASLLLLLAVEVIGVVGMGAQRWVDLGLFQLQPSEVMKIALVLALARFYHGIPLEEVGRIFKVTRERVRQIEAKAVRKLQNPVRSQHLEGFMPTASLYGKPENETPNQNDSKPMDFVVETPLNEF